MYLKSRKDANQLQMRPSKTNMKNKTQFSLVHNIKRQYKTSINETKNLKYKVGTKKL